jgi:hypothetical protein
MWLGSGGRPSGAAIKFGSASGLVLSRMFVLLGTNLATPLAATGDRNACCRLKPPEKIAPSHRVSGFS